MKLVRYTIWVLLTFVVIATLDSQPDPPAVNPSTARCTVLQHDCTCETVAQRCDSVATASPFPISLLAAEASEPPRPTDGMVFTVHAADPSPPLLPLDALIFQS
jgi:hypothetical protein